MDFAAGCIGGCAGILAGHPLDTLKVHLQTGTGNVLQCMRQVIKNGGLSSMYRGVGAPLAGVGAVNAIVFGTYGTTRRFLSDSDSLTTHAIAGATAGLLQSFACSPIELVKTRQQLSLDKIPQGAWAGIKYIYGANGVKSLFRGLGLTIARDCPAFAIYFTSFEAMTRHDRSAKNVFLAGGVAGALSWILLYPIDVVKSRVQGDVYGKWSGARDCFYGTVKAEGWKAMLKGVSTVTVRAFFSNGACFTAVVWTEYLWNKCRVQIGSLVHVAEVMCCDTADCFCDL